MTTQNIAAPDGAANRADELLTSSADRLLGETLAGNLVDLRESLVNDRKVGTFADVQVAVESITALHGILLDFDPDLLRDDNGIFPPDIAPQSFFEKIEPVLNRHPLARHAEVRATGRGLHAIIFLEPVVELFTGADQIRWKGAAKAVQRTLPVDPRQPGITAVTRPLGSVNGKNGAKVELLRQGKAVSATNVADYLAEVASAPFRTVAGVLLGADRVEPCPFCRKEGSRLDILDRLGKCYRRCGEIRLAQIFDLVYAARENGASLTTPA